jgi:hypothetical protein
MCTANSQKFLPDFLTNLDGTSVTFPDKDGKDGRPAPITRAADVPLGNGMADAAKTSILSRRERYQAALEDSGA